MARACSPAMGSSRPLISSRCRCPGWPEATAFGPQRPNDRATWTSTRILRGWPTAGLASASPDSPRRRAGESAANSATSAPPQAASHKGEFDKTRGVTRGHKQCNAVGSRQIVAILQHRLTAIPAVAVPRRRSPRLPDAEQRLARDAPADRAAAARRHSPRGLRPDGRKANRTIPALGAVLPASRVFPVDGSPRGV